MAQINTMITSEIDGLDNTSRKMKDFLKWVLDFERENIDKEMYAYRDNIEKKLIELLGVETEEKSQEEKNVVHK